MKRLILLLLALTPAFVVAQNPSCPRVWRSGDTLWTDPAPQIQWLREGTSIPDANRNWFLPPPNESAHYSVSVRGGISPAFSYAAGAGYTLAGYVFDEQHRPVEGAAVRRGPYSTTTDERGRFALKVIAPKPQEQTPVVVTVEKEGCWRNASRLYVSLFDTTETQFMLHARRVTNHVDATKGGEMAYRGFTLHLPPDAVQTESGLPYVGTILLSVQGALPSDPDFGLRMPGGDFAGVDGSGGAALLHSYGYLTAEMRTENGELLELRPESRATLRFHLPFSETHRPDSVPLWHFNETTAVWEQEGWSFRNGSIYEGQVSHFSSWNLDVPTDRATVRGRVVDCNGEPEKGGWVRLGQRHVVTDSLGQYWAFVPGDFAFDVWTQQDTLRNVVVPAQQEQTLDDLRGQDFGGVAVWNTRTQSLRVNLWGKVPEGLRLSIDGGRTWTAERELAGVDSAPETVFQDGGCGGQLNVVTLGQSGDCRDMTENDLLSQKMFFSLEEALSADITYRFYSYETYGRLAGKWDSFGYLECLQDFFLETVEFESFDPSIPELDWVNKVPHLKWISIRNSNLFAVPESFRNLTRLELLDLSYCNLRALPEWLSEFTQLKHLHIESNPMPVPEWIGGFRQLASLSIGNEDLVEVPAWIENLPELRELSIKHSPLSDAPDWIGNLNQLQHLELSSTDLTSLPESFANLTQLQELILSYNQLTGVPEFVVGMSQLNWLDLESNMLSSLPEFIGNLTQLTNLSLSHNRLTSVPASISNLSLLRQLSLSFNPLITLPESIGNLHQLQFLSLAGCQITSLPEAIGNMPQIQAINLAYNQLTDLPVSIASLADTLTDLRLIDNPIPEERRAAIQAMLPNTSITW